MNKKIKVAFVGLSVIIFGISLFQECYTVNGQASVGSFGLVAYLLGWMNLSNSFFVWLANPFYMLTIVFLFLNKKAQVLTGFISLLLSLLFQMINEIVINEGGMVDTINGYLSGYWLWVCSIAIVFFATLINAASNKVSIT